jgi:DNA repair protein RecN (Recombination protein N)
LVDLQQQFGHLALEDDDFQTNTLDAIADSMALAADYNTAFRQWKSAQRKLDEQLAAQNKRKQEADYKQYLLEELAQAAFAPDEIERAEEQMKQLSNAERIIMVLQGGQTALNEGEQPIVTELRRLAQQLLSIADVYPGIKPLQERLASVWAEVKDIAAELESEQEKVTIDPALMDELQQRIDLGYKLLKKHGLKTTTELIVLQQQLEDDLHQMGVLDDNITELTETVARLQKTVDTLGAELSAKRHAASGDFAARINELLVLVGMPNARFAVDIAAIPPCPTGTDRIGFLLDANKSGNVQPLHKAASGGEMSRIMLCIKSTVARALHLPTLIFDEVDTGISGEAARQVGDLLRTLSQYHQVICITHQPQVAARGKRHFYVYKEVNGNGRINTQVRTLQGDERVLAIARMIGGEKPTEAAINSAKELMG